MARPGPVRTLVIGPGDAGKTVAAILKSRLALSWSQARQLVERRHVVLQGSPCLDPNRRTRAGQRLQIREPGNSMPPAPKEPTLVRHMDEHIIVVDKPPGLTTMRHPEEAAEFGARGKRFLPKTLADLVTATIAGRNPGRQSRIRPVHRLDKDTSGLVVFARTPAAERNLGQQFRGHTIDRRYLAVVRGRATPGRIESILVRDRGDGRRGSGTACTEGQRAVTHVRVMELLGEFTLVECRLETGRTHQVRIHLGESGTPLCGERIYDRPLHGRPVPDTSSSPRLALHAASLGLLHPVTGKLVRWESSMPGDLADLIGRLRLRAARG